MTNLCIDCKYYDKNRISGSDFSKCKHPSCMNLIDGSGGSYCSTERSYGCGINGRNFVSKYEKSKPEPLILDNGVYVPRKSKVKLLDKILNLINF